jgi:outer membrane protein
MYTKELKSLTDEYQKKVIEFQQLSPSTAQAILDIKRAEIQQMEERIQGFQQSAQDDIQKKSEEYLLPIEKKVKDAIKAVAKESSFTYVFDINTPGLLYAIETDDITGLVKKKLGLK